MLYVSQTPLVLAPRPPQAEPGSPLCEQAASLFRAGGPATPVLDDSATAAEFDIARDSGKFVAGWPCLKMLGDCVEISAEEQKAKPAITFFSAANPTDATTRRAFQQAYQNHSHDHQSVRQEIGKEALAQARHTATELDNKLSADEVRLRQAYRVNDAGQGIPYLHTRDASFAALLDAGDAPIHTFLPGYATGDRYALILATLVNPRLHVSIAHTRGNESEQKHAREAFDVIRHALLATGQPGAESRVSLLEYSGRSLKNARESLDDPATRADFRRIDGPSSPLEGAVGLKDSHVFHISVTTELIARRFRDTSVPYTERCMEIRNTLRGLVKPCDRQQIDALVATVIAEQGIQPGATALWIADREFANAREAEAISRPMMFEQIADALGRTGMPVYCVADTYINRARDENGKDHLTDRHPYRPTLHPHIGRFWAAEVEGKPLLAPRENQWYFMHKLLDTVGGPVIGIRSGALEPFALMGHQVIYLEHKDMFTPERHACWQGIIPYHRLIIDHTAGYLDKRTELQRRNEIRSQLSEVLQHRPPSGNPSTEVMRSRSSGLASRQAALEALEEDLRVGVLSGNELKLLVAMVRSQATALQTARMPGTFDDRQTKP